MSAKCDGIDCQCLSNKLGSVKINSNIYYEGYLWDQMALVQRNDVQRISTITEIPNDGKRMSITP